MDETKVHTIDVGREDTALVVVSPDFNGEPAATLIFNGRPVFYESNSGYGSWLLPYRQTGSETTIVLDTIMVLHYTVGAITEAQLEAWHDRAMDWSAFDDILSEEDEHAMFDWLDNNVRSHVTER